MFFSFSCKFDLFGKVTFFETEFWDNVEHMNTSLGYADATISNDAYVGKCPYPILKYEARDRKIGNGIRNSFYGLFGFF